MHPLPHLHRPYGHARRRGQKIRPCPGCDRPDYERKEMLEKVIKAHPRQAILGLKGAPDGRKAALTFQWRQKGAFWGGVQNRLDLRSAHFLLEK